jgi:hypothetical protein
MAMKLGHHLGYSAWTFWNGGWSCGGGCCNDDGLDLEESVDTLERFCEGRFEEVDILPKVLT